MRQMFQSLESRLLLAVALDAQGFTVVTPASDTRIVYVSSSTGNDANNGLSASTPVQTLSRGQSLIRDGYADWLLLKRGDTFGAFGWWQKRGRSPSEPVVIGAYGTGPRPQINTGTGFGLVTYAFGVNGRNYDNLVIQSLSFFPHTYNHTNGNGELAGIRLLGQASNVLIEDCRIAGYKDNVVLDPADRGLRDVTIRRCQIVDAHAGAGVGNGHSQGIYVGANVQRLTLAENVIDHNGWRPNTQADRTFNNHNVYVQAGAKDVVLRDNVITRAGMYGIKFNAGGTATGNFFARNSESVYLERASLVAGNVITEAVDHPFGGWGVGINTQKAPSATIRGNLVMKALSATASGVAGIQLFNNGTPFSGLVEYNTVYNWRNGLLIGTPGSGPGSVQIRFNQVHTVQSDTAAADQRSSAAQATFVYSGNVYSAGTRTNVNRIGSNYLSVSQWRTAASEPDAQYQLPSYPDPGRDIAGYAASIGLGASFDAYIAAARALERTSWNGSLLPSGVNPWLWRGVDDGTSPRVFAQRFDHERAPIGVEIMLSKDVGSSLTASDAVVRNVQTNATISVTSLVYSPASRIARFNLPTNLPDGSYRLTLPAGSVQDAAGRTLASDFVFNFRMLRGDADGNGLIDFDDYARIDAGFLAGSSGFSNGDFNHDGLINFDDYAIIDFAYLNQP